MTEEQNHQPEESDVVAQVTHNPPVESGGVEESVDAPHSTLENQHADVEGEPLEASSDEDESEVAADYLEELLDIADLDGDIEIEVRQNRTYLSVVTDEEDTEDLQLLVGQRGEVLDALQELVRLAVLASTGNRSRLILDIAGHRERREESLRKLAQGAVNAAESTGEAQHLKPLSPYERKVVHDFVADLGYRSESEGEGSKRHVVVTGAHSGDEGATNEDAANE